MHLHSTQEAVRMRKSLAPVRFIYLLAAPVEEVGERYLAEGCVESFQLLALLPKDTQLWCPFR